MFDEVVEGVDSIVHAASPLADQSDPDMDPNFYTILAIQGAIGILKSATNSPSVKWVVITSSAASVMDLLPKRIPSVYEEVCGLTYLHEGYQS